MDLHDLTKVHGVDLIASMLGMTPRALVDVRRGATPLQVDDLYELERSFPAFDALGTVRRIGAVRESRAWNRKSRFEARNGD